MSAEDFDDEFTDYEREILANIDAHGCHIPFVFGAKNGQPDFAYSVGFPHTVDQGEVIVFGLPQKLMGYMINATLRQCRDEGLILGDNVRISGLLKAFDVIARIVRPDRIERAFLNSAMWHHFGRYGTGLKVVYQLVWPSAATGLFPWDEGCHPDVIARQPALYEPRLAA